LTTITRPTGVIIAPPMPWSVRSRINSGSACTNPHSTELTVNITIADMNTRLAP
jgi:hypothetical protein